MEQRKQSTDEKRSKNRKSRRFRNSTFMRFLNGNIEEKTKEKISNNNKITEKKKKKRSLKLRKKLEPTFSAIDTTKGNIKEPAVSKIKQVINTEIDTNIDDSDDEQGNINRQNIQGFVQEKKSDTVNPITDQQKINEMNNRKLAKTDGQRDNIGITIINQKHLYNKKQKNNLQENGQQKDGKALQANKANLKGIIKKDPLNVDITEDDAATCEADDDLGIIGGGSSFEKNNDIFTGTVNNKEVTTPQFSEDIDEKTKFETVQAVQQPAICHNRRRSLRWRTPKDSNTPGTIASSVPSIDVKKGNQLEKNIGNDQEIILMKTEPNLKAVSNVSSEKPELKILEFFRIKGLLENALSTSENNQVALYFTMDTLPSPNPEIYGLMEKALDYAINRSRQNELGALNYNFLSNRTLAKKMLIEALRSNKTMLPACWKYNKPSKDEIDEGRSKEVNKTNFKSKKNTTEDNILKSSKSGESNGIKKKESKDKLDEREEKARKNYEAEEQSFFNLLLPAAYRLFNWK